MPAYSPSALDLFEKCPLAFRYRYVDRLQDRLGETLEQFLGKTVHSTLEWVHTRAADGAPPLWHEILQDFHNRYDSGFSDDTRIVKQERTRSGYRKLGERCLRNYYEANTPFDAHSLVGVEWDFRFRILPESTSPLVTGRIDRISRVSRLHIQVHDYKTGSYVPPRHELERSRQPRIYALAVRHAFPDVQEGRVELVWHYLQSGMRATFEIREAGLRRCVQEVTDLVRTIEKEEAYAPRPSRLCPWCEYGHVCPEFSYRSQVDQSATSPLGPEEGLLLVDRLERLTALRREFERDYKRQKSDLEEAIVDRARLRGVGALVGSRKEAVVSKDGRVRLRKRRA